MDACTLPLYRGGEEIGRTLVDADDIERLSAFRWTIGADGYAKRTTARNGRTVYVMLHREVLNLPHGVGFTAGVVDHISGDKLDNRKANLRLTTHGANTQRGTRAVARSGYRGVYAKDRAWEVLISVNGSRQRLGSFPYPEIAALAYDLAARQHYGQHARVNFPATDLRDWLDRMAQEVA